MRGKSICALMLICCVASLSAAQSRRFLGRKEARPFTRDLPAVTKVELLKLKLNGDIWSGEVESVKAVEGANARKIASVWRTQTYLPYLAACHEPAYAIKFYAQDKLLVYASVCWACNNIGFLNPDLPGTQYFVGGNKKGQQLLQIFKTAFPEAN